MENIIKTEMEAGLLQRVIEGFRKEGLGFQALRLGIHNFIQAGKHSRYDQVLAWSLLPSLWITHVFGNYLPNGLQ